MVTTMGFINTSTLKPSVTDTWIAYLKHQMCTAY